MGMETWKIHINGILVENLWGHTCAQAQKRVELI